MDAGHEKLLEAFEDFEVDLEVEEILEKVKRELVLDPSVVEFGEKLKRRERGPCKSWNPLNVTWMTFRFFLFFFFCKKLIERHVTRRLGAGHGRCRGF